MAKGELIEVAETYIDNRFQLRSPGKRSGNLADMVVCLDEDYCRRVADWYETAPRDARDGRHGRLNRLYGQFKSENLRQYQAIRDAGIRVRPWQEPGQPYWRSADLRNSLRYSGILYVYRTAAGHGTGKVETNHPMLEPSGVVEDGVELVHNDIFRSVHDVFGHVMFDNSFSIRGELRASLCHMQMYPEEVHAVLLTEQIAQICWYFFGPHLRLGQPRRYPEQKVFEFPKHFLDEFKDLFVHSVSTKD